MTTTIPSPVKAALPLFQPLTVHGLAIPIPSAMTLATSSSAPGGVPGTDIAGY